MHVSLDSQREVEVTKAVEGYSDPDKVWQVRHNAVAEAVADPRLLIPSSLSYPQRNMKLMRSKGSGEMEQLLERCKQVDEREGE